MKNLKKLREERNLTQQQLADILSVTQQAIYKYEHSISEPNLKTLIQMADYFDTTIDYLVSRTDFETDIDTPKLTHLELKHLKSYRKLDSKARSHIDGIMEAIEKE